MSAFNENPVFTCRVPGIPQDILVLTWNGWKKETGYTRNNKEATKVGNPVLYSFKKRPNISWCILYMLTFKSQTFLNHAPIWFWWQKFFAIPSCFHFFIPVNENCKINVHENLFYPNTILWKSDKLNVKSACFTLQLCQCYVYISNYGLQALRNPSWGHSGRCPKV